MSLNIDPARLLGYARRCIWHFFQWKLSTQNAVIYGLLNILVLDVATRHIQCLAWNRLLLLAVCHLLENTGYGLKSFHGLHRILHFSRVPWRL